MKKQPVMHKYIHSLEELKDQKVVFKIRFKGYKLWAINGDIKAAEHRLFEGLI